MNRDQYYPANLGKIKAWTNHAERRSSLRRRATLFLIVEYDEGNRMNDAAIAVTSIRPPPFKGAGNCTQYFYMQFVPQGVLEKMIWNTSGGAVAMSQRSIGNIQNQTRTPNRTVATSKGPGPAGKHCYRVHVFWPLNSFRKHICDRLVKP